MKKCRVSGLVLTPGGEPLPQGSIEFTMSQRDRDGTATIIPHAVTAKVSGDGSIDVELWPNSRGFAGTKYTARVRAKDGSGYVVTYQAFTVVVPDAETAILADISDSEPPPSVDDARQQVLLARELRDETLGLTGQVRTDRQYVEGAVAHIDEVGQHGGGGWDALVGALAGRDAFNDQAAGFRVMVANNGSGQAVIYEKTGDRPADWSMPVPFTGPRGKEGEARTFLHEQMIPSDLWVINHGFDARPNVSITDGGSTEVVGDVDHPSPGIATVKFAFPVIGRARLI